MPAWRITIDKIEDGKAIGVTHADSPAEAASPMPLKFRMYDGDDILYYEGVATLDCEFEPLDHFGTPNAGCTRIAYFERGAWKTL